MTAFTTQEQQEIDRANAEGKQPVVFVQGLWLLASSWDNWRALFEEQGYTTLAPGWPDDPQTVVQATDDPEVFANKHIKQVTDHYADAIRQLKRKPAVIGHSFGGLIAQQLADEGLTEDRVNTKNPARGPLLLIAGEQDHTVPLAVVTAEYKLQQYNPSVTEFHEMPYRGHSLTIDHGWREVAETALAFIAKQLKSS
jgi:non-heme chloroperoxidase